MGDVERQRAHFESISERYLTARGSATHLSLKSLLWNDFLSRNRRWLSAVEHVLEPMCGYGEGKAILEAGLGKRFEYVGFDTSRPLVEEAGRRLPGCRIFVQDVTRFEAQGQFDLVILIGGLHHVHAQSAEVLRRLCSALKPCGCLINFEPTQNNSIARAVRNRVYRRNTLFDAQTERGFDLSELNALYQGAGFQIVDQAFPGLLAYVLYYNPDAFPALNRGGVGLVRTLYALERRFYRSAPARWASFATLTLLTRRDSAHTSKSATVSTRA
jgi:SAM-dependent methyltransferase